MYSGDSRANYTVVDVGKHKRSRRWLVIGFGVCSSLLFWRYSVSHRANPNPETDVANPTPRSVSQSRGPARNRAVPSGFRRVGSASRNSVPSTEQVHSLSADTGDPVVYDVEGEGLADALRSIRRDVQRCFEKGLKEDDITGGKTVFQFTIEKRVDDPRNADLAMVTEVGVQDTTIDSEMVEECVMQKLEGLLFEPPDEPVEVVLPVALSVPIEE